MAIKEGDRVPAATLHTMRDGKPTAVTTAELFDGKKVVLFAVPGAFTPTCSMAHLPGYVVHADAIKAKGVDTIAVVAVNDVFVMKAWQEATSGKDKITYLADGNGDFVKACGLDMDLSAGGLGLRSKRFSMIVDDGKVLALNIEDSPGKAVASGAETLLQQL